MKLSDKLIELRKEKGWSQEDFAEKLDVSRQAISRWENGTALPDAQNILRISKLFNVTADYLLNDDYEEEIHIHTDKTVTKETESLTWKKKFPYWYLISTICFVILTFLLIMKVVNSSNAAHLHPILRSVKENEIAPTCMAEGFYDEVVYCTECGEEVLRTQRSIEMVAHQFQNRKCIVCDEPQPSEGLFYMSNGNGTCVVDVGECTDENIVIPDYSPSGEKVVKIKDYAFAGDNKLKSVRVPETVTVIGEGAFQDCKNLERVNLPSEITTIYSYTFLGCENLKEIKIPEGVKEIGEEAFAECRACESIVIPACVTKIGKFAFRSFSGCDGNVMFEICDGWGVYDHSGTLVCVIDFKSTVFKPVMYITVKYSEYVWERN